MSSFVFSLAVDVDGRWAYQMNSLDVYDEGLSRAVLAFAREHQLGRGPDARPLAVVPGFSYGAYRFDAVAAASPSVHGYHHGRNAALNEVVSAVFPAYQCEFRGDENLEEAVLRFKRMLRPTIVSRPPVPYLRMRYENTRTGGGSVGPSRGFTTHDVLERELRLLEGAPGSFVEFENSRGEVWNVEWNGSWLVNDTPQDGPPSEDWAASALGCP
ncbi:hypothetical protein [Streptomyces inhibens]|uniref:hypothetical protein n=1 Tax=Streptomyces inhibens TaxID=2293571 RepID=UPI001EE6AA56|nr:hypothetical protein [Streptomyces inhibens]UKY47893.1 hypothetical protein KI385_03030 [Streptomyces inhibens]